MSDPSGAGPSQETGGTGLAAEGIRQWDVEPVNAKAHRELYKKRVQIYPKLVHGTFRSLKWLVMLVTLTIYYGTPWIRWDRGAGYPDQAVLVDFENSRFYFFWIEIWPQEVYFITGLLILAALFLFFVTALFGRVWCGYVCPQTVWVDLFIAIERFFEGDRNARIRLDKAPLSLNKLWRKSAKHLSWLLVAFATGGAWVFYFNDAPTLLQEFPAGDAKMSTYLFVGVLTFTTYSLGGLMREQVCTYMCPWPRIQAALIDEESLAVTYRADRGEPRGPHKKGESWDSRGDCIDCKQCVVACPMGIDIRDGLQLECIQCALCIDACDDIMDKVGRPRGLIAYDTDLNEERRERGEPARFNFVRVRTVLYAVLIAGISALMLYALATRTLLEINVLHDRNPLFVTLGDGGVRNGYTVKILNMRREERTYQLRIEGLPGANLKLVGRPETGATLPPITVGPDRSHRLRLYVSVPGDALPEADRHPILFVLEDRALGITETEESVFVRR